MNAHPIRFTEDGFHQFRNDYKKSSIQGTHVTFLHGRTHALTSGHVPLVLLGEIVKSTYKEEAVTIPMEKSFKYVSLFSGIGGFEMALNKLGGQCVLASEIDKFARQAYEVLHDMEPAGDVTEIPAESVPDHDLLVGGFPYV